MRKLWKLFVSLLLITFFLVPLQNIVEASNRVPTVEKDLFSQLTEPGFLKDPNEVGVKTGNTLRQNILALFYPQAGEGGNSIYKVIRDITLGIMIAFFVWAGASMLFDRKPEDLKKTRLSLLYILVGGLFVYGANWIFGDVLDFNESDFTAGDGFQGVENSARSVFFVILSALKGFAFFLAIIVTVITGFRIIAAGEGEKGKKLVKGLINVGIALMIIKGIDFIYYIAADTTTFVKNAADTIINIAKVFGYIYGVIIVIMVIIAGYFYITNGGGESNFKKASNILVNILLSALILFAFLLILYQVFAEFQTGGDAVTDETTSFIMRNYV